MLASLLVTHTLLKFGPITAACSSFIGLAKLYSPMHDSVASTAAGNQNWNHTNPAIYQSLTSNSQRVPPEDAPNAGSARLPALPLPLLPPHKVAAPDKLSAPGMLQL